MPAASCDVLVVGGGPAGSTCAWQLVRAGLDVMVMDKQAFPRDKVCAGWITPEVIASLELDCTHYAQSRVLQPIHGFRTGMIGETPVETHYDGTASFGIRRCEFDDYLLRRSQARLRLGEPVRTMVRNGDGWLVNGEIRAPMVVGAGGHFCPVSRLLGSRPASGEAVVCAQEVEFPYRADQRSACPIPGDVAQLYFCADLKGYGWCFPKGDYLNIGLGREDSHRLPEHVQRFCEWLQQRGGMPDNLGGRFNGHAYLLYPASRRKLTGDGVLFVGDAAGLAYPQSGEGIFPAVESGLIAAHVIIEAAKDYRQHQLEPYVTRLTQRLGKRNQRPTDASWLPLKFKQRLARRLMASEWFARHVVIDRWFLHTGRRTLPAR